MEHSLRYNVFISLKEVIIMTNTDDKNERHKRKGVRFSEGIVLAGLPALIYLITYYFERGYGGYYKLPDDLIQVTFSGVLNTFVVISSLVSFSFLTLNIAWTLFPVQKNPALNSLRTITAFVFVFASYVIFAFGTRNWRIWIPYIIMAFIYLLIFWGTPLIHKGNTYVEKVEANIKVDRNVSSFFDFLVSSFGVNVLIILLAIFSIPALSNVSGRASAINQEDFLVVNTIPEVVVIRNYDGNLIASPFDRQTKQVESIFIIIDISEHPDLLLIPESVGPLEVVEPTTTSIQMKPSVTPTPVPSP